ncbi:cell division protein ZapE [Thiocapsa imhoffii]|uniref:Cell division protein ZapE n=1 Tax=Thiocapsa imhoffii TaxID=382777 RepID=A0A9X0WJA5_9GAMM|nr:cell division protein ZapE [Thiocapsa imhoffii]MBK1645766.1 cell division protein ZapE [Thiocapsa imhoffii]
MSTFIPLDAAQQEASERLLEIHQALSATATTTPGRVGFIGQWRTRLRQGAVRPPPVKGLYLWGDVGRGKTYLMDWFARDLELAGKRRVHFHHFIRDVHDRLSRLPKQPDPLEVIAQDLCSETRVLCLDEFLVTDITDAMILHGLLRALFARGITLITTANTRPEELYRNGLQRQRFLPAIELLQRHTQVFELDGGRDYRLRALTRGGVFFVIDAVAPAATEQALSTYFEQLTGGHTDGSGSQLTVNGRSIPMRRAGADVIWFDFDALCGTPRSAADYIEIAREFHTLFLSDVPVLGPAHEAAARRFLVLVDELYDQGVKLILSSTVPVERLYAGGLVDFAHERLISRLIEMQSERYLAAVAE